MSILTVRLEVIQYGGWKELEVAINTERPDTKTLYLTYPTTEIILGYRENSVREKLASKSLKAFLGAGRTVGKFSGRIVNKPDLVGATAKVSLIELDDFLALATWEAVVNQNLEVGKILAAGLGDSLRSLAYEQLGIELGIEDRQQYLAQRMQHRQHFHPYLTRWLKEDAGGDNSAVDWGWEVNHFKRACKLPLTGVDTWDYDLLATLNRAESGYNMLRIAGLRHEQAIAVIRTQH